MAWKYYPVGSSITLVSFLCWKKGILQPWRLKHLIKSRYSKCRQAVQVARGNRWLQLTGPNTRLRDGDIVQVEDPLPAACTRAFEAIPAADYRDYAFIPGKSSFDKKMARVISKRSQTIWIKDSVVNSLFSFIYALKNNPAITEPIRHLIVVSHANPEGFLFIELLTAMGDVITYEDLEKAVTNKNLFIDNRLLEPRPKDRSNRPVAAAVLILGCRIGSDRALPYLKKLKEALGNKVTVIASKHFHNAIQQVKWPTGYIEFMSYGFSIHRPKQLTTKAEAIQAFSKAIPHFTRIDNKPVPASLWKKWIPSAHLNKPGNNSVFAKVKLPSTNTNEWVPGYFRYKYRKFLTKNGSFALAKDPPAPRQAGKTPWAKN